MRTLTTWIFGLALVAAPSFGAKGDAAKGKEVFEQCSACHNPDSAEKKMGPGLKGIGKQNEGKVRAKIDEGGNGMPAYKDILSQQEKDDLVAYLKTL